MVKKDLSTTERNKIVQYLLSNCHPNGKPRRGVMKEATSMFKTSKRTVTRLWAAAKEQKAEGQPIFLKSKKPKAPRRKRVQIDFALIESLELHKRNTIERLAQGINKSPTTVWRWVKQGLLRSCTSTIKPDLTAPNKLLRLRFSLEALEFDSLSNVLRFRTMKNTVHIDEKWFYITKTMHRFYLTPNEEDPHRTCKSKQFITKVMFMCAVCRPIYDADGGVVFDGKIGIFPFTQQVPALRNSKNREKGTLETKPIQSITKEVIKDCVINKILPAIRAKWPTNGCKQIFIHQDNARPHISDSDPDFRVAASLDGFQIRFVQQPPNSPDLNVNDLGWFNSIQSLQVQSATYNVDQLVEAVVESYQQLSPCKLNKVFLTLQTCMIQIMQEKGHNKYKTPHMKKNALIRLNALPTDLEVPMSLVQECMTYLEANDSINNVELLMEHLGYPFYQQEIMEQLALMHIDEEHIDACSNAGDEGEDI